MPNFYSDNKDMQFYSEKYIDWNKIANMIGVDPDIIDDSVQVYKDILNTVGEFVANEIHPRIKELDTHPLSVENGNVKVAPAFSEIFNKMKEIGLFGLVSPCEFGGMGAPLTLYYMVNEIIARADVSIMTHYGFHEAIAIALIVYCIENNETDFVNNSFENMRFQKEIEEIVLGNAWGSMDITEPNAGSDMSQIATKGEQDENGNWFVTGQKIFITSGHGKYHIVIARTSGKNDLKGLSLFLVPAYDDNGWKAEVERVEHKLGHNASPTCTINYDKTPAHLIGNPGDGFKYMLVLMNSARLGVGLESLGVCEAATQMAKAYADERVTMGKPISKHEMIADYLDSMEIDTIGVRAMAMEAAVEEETVFAHRIKCKYNGESSSELKRASLAGRRFTPLLKYIAAEKSVELSRLNIQIHGGVGYTKEFEAEKLLRDAVVLPIYEGTSQIQALMATKDTLSECIKRPQVILLNILKHLRCSLINNRQESKRVHKIKLTTELAKVYIMYRIFMDKFNRSGLKGLMKIGSDDFSFALLNAERLTQILVDNAICEILLKQSNLYSERESILKRYLRYAEPRVRYMVDLIKTS